MRKPLTTTQARALELIERGTSLQAGRAYGEGEGIRRTTANALASRGLVVLGELTWEGGSAKDPATRISPWALPIARLSTPPVGFVACYEKSLEAERRRPGRPARAGSRATVKIEFRVTEAERASIAATLEASSAGSLSELIRDLLAAESDRLGRRGRSS